MPYALDLQDSRTAKILELEKQRQHAYLTRDFDQLHNLFGPVISYVHSTGKVDDRETYLANVVNVPEFLSIERPDLKLHFIGQDSAILTGLLRTHIRRDTGHEERSDSYLTQVWELQAGEWRQVHYQLTRAQA